MLTLPLTWKNSIICLLPTGEQFNMVLTSVSTDGISIGFDAPRSVSFQQIKSKSDQQFQTIVPPKDFDRPLVLGNNSMDLKFEIHDEVWYDLQQHCLASRHTLDLRSPFRFIHIGHIVSLIKDSPYVQIALSTPYPRHAHAGELKANKP